MTKEEQWEITCILSSIKWYTHEYSLTAQQLSYIFHEGVVACYKNGTFTPPILNPGEIPGLKSWTAYAEGEVPESERKSK